jgi:GTPase Era involved in 16S rRNA processing
MSQTKPAVISVIGPTNVGKTSIVATLANTNEYKDSIVAKGGTQVKFPVHGDRLECPPYTIYMKICDTPGFQCSAKIFRKLDKTFDLDNILSQAKNLHKDDFNAWQAIEQSNIVLLVIDLSKSPENDSETIVTIKLLQSCGRPCIAIFNFLEASKNDVTCKQKWIQVLKQNGFFWISEYDALCRDFVREIELLTKISSFDEHVLNQQQKNWIKESISQRRGNENRRIRECRELLAELIFDITSYNITKYNVAANIKEQTEKEIKEELLKKISYASLNTVYTMTECWKFNQDMLKNIGYTHLRNTSKDSTQVDNPKLQWYQKIGIGMIILLGATVDVCGGCGIGTATAVAISGGLFGKPVITSTKNYFWNTYTISAKYDVRSIESLIRWHVAVLKALRERGQAASHDRNEDNYVPFNIDTTTKENYTIKNLHSALKRQNSMANLCLIDNATAIDNKKQLTASQMETRKKICAEIAECLEKDIPNLRSIPNN